MTYNVYLDQYGYVIGVELYEGTLNYVFITGYDLNSSNISVKTADAAGIFLDGNMQKITVDVKATNDNIEDSTDPYTRRLGRATAAVRTTTTISLLWMAYNSLNRWYSLTPWTRMALHSEARQAHDCHLL